MELNDLNECIPDSAIDYLCPCALVAHSLPQLYYCPDCTLLSCNSCTSKEINCYYCPQCLFEVPFASVKADWMLCARSCFKCPGCRCSLVIKSINTEQESPVYYLSCPTCRWESLESGLQLDRPTGIWRM